MSSRRSIPTEDIISTLPDSVICHILSFLPTKQAASTSILSKRWNPLWLSVLTLDFNQHNFRDFATFRYFVFSVMLLRNITLPIQSVRLKCDYSLKSAFNHQDVNIFIHAVAQRGIQNLNLESHHFELPLPLKVYNCTNLVVLKLKRISIHIFKVNFPLLKTLHLEDIRSSLLRPKFLKTFLYGCPVLEELQLQDVVLLDYKYGKFHGLLKLVKANIFNSTPSNWNFPFAWICNAKFLCVKLRRPYVCQVTTSLNLTHMKIIFERTNDWLGKWMWLIEVLQNCPKLENLTIHEDSSNGEEIGDDDWVDPSIVPKCLLLELRTFSLIAIKGRKYELQFAEYILKNAKALHTMKVSSSMVDLKIKHEMLRKLSLCPRGSTTCKLSFD